LTLDPPAAVEAAVREGWDRLRQGQFDEAVARFRDAAREARALDEPNAEAWAHAQEAIAWESRGETAAAWTSLSHALEAVRRIPEPLQRATALSALAQRAIVLGDVPQARAVAEEAVQAARAAADRAVLASALIHRGTVAIADNEDGRALYDEAIAQFPDDEMGRAACLNVVASLVGQGGDLAAARDLHGRALEAARRADSPEALHECWTWIGHLEFAESRLDDAREAFRQARAAAERSHEVGRAAEAIRNAAIVEERAGNIDVALAGFADALKRYQELVDEEREMESLRNLLNVARQCSTPEVAERHKRRALALARRHGGQPLILELLDFIGEACYKAGNFHKALDYWETALPLARELGDVRRESVLLEHLRFVYQSRGRPDLALEPVRELLALYGRLGEDRHAASSCCHLCEVYFALGEIDAAADAAARGLEFVERGPDERLEAMLRGNLANAVLTQGQAAAALPLYEQVLETWRRLGDAGGMFMALSNMAVTHHLLGDDEAATRCQAEADALRPGL